MEAKEAKNVSRSFCIFRPLRIADFSVAGEVRRINDTISILEECQTQQYMQE